MRRLAVAFIGIVAAAGMFYGPPGVSAADSIDGKQLVASHEGSSGTESLPAEVDFGRAKRVFEKTCSQCHSIQRPLSRKKSRAGWEKTITRMSSNHKARFGKGIPPLDREEIISYLFAKNTFEATCSKCHALKRPLGKTKNRAGWERTVARMSKNHKGRFGETIPDETQAAIIGYLLENAGR